MSNTPRLKLPYIATAQAGKEITHNEALAILDAIGGGGGIILDLDLDTPPVSPAEGDVYLVAPTGTGDWAGHDGELAHYIDSGWEFLPMPSPLIAYIKDLARLMIWDGAAWAGVSDTEWGWAIHPPFPAAVQADRSSSGAHTGTWSTEVIEPTSGSFLTAYRWTSAEVALQDTDLVMILTIPGDWRGWGDDGIQIEYRTKTTTSTDQAMDLTIRANGASIAYNDTGLVSDTAETWTEAGPTGLALESLGVGPGDEIVIVCRCYALGGNYVEIGTVGINWIRGG